MNSVGQRLRDALWFFPLDKFIIVFGLYAFMSVSTLLIRGTGIFSALLATFGFGIVFFVFAIVVERNTGLFGNGIRDDKPFASRLLFGPIKRSENKRGQKQTNTGARELGDLAVFAPNVEPPSGIEDENFKRRMRVNQIDSARRAARKMHDKVIHTGLFVAVYMVLFWFSSNSITDFFTSILGSGQSSLGGTLAGGGDISFSSPSELFIIDWFLLVVIWILIVIYFPRWFVFLMLIAISGMRIMLLIFGVMSSAWVMNIAMLPVFYMVMMVFFFGSIMWPFLQQIKYFRPGDASWGTPKGSMRGQPEVRATVETELAKFSDYIQGKSKRQPTRGMIFEGPPGTGKTLYAKEIATEYNIPFVLADGAAFSGVPLPNLVMKYIEWRTNSLADEYGGVVFFIDEAELLLGARQGMGSGGPAIGYGKIRDVWDLLPYDRIGATSSCGVSYDSSATRERFWGLKEPAYLADEKKIQTHPFFMPVGMGGGSSGAIYPFLTWLQGTGSPGFSSTFKRRIVNDLLDGLFIPSNIPGTQKVLRLPPARPKHRTILFIGATNRAFMIDPAIRRPGRMGVPVRFKTPDFESRKDIINLYFTKVNKDGLLRPELMADEVIDEFARATGGMSPAEIEASINTAYDVRGTHIKNLLRIKGLLGKGVIFDNLLESDRKYWLRHKDELDSADWDDDRADMRSLLEARNALIYGKADPGLTTGQHREQTAIHEYWGHFLTLKAALGDVIRPSVISVMPRGNALGMISHIPVEERDPKPQHYYKGLLRVSMGSIVAERFFFGENQPGVSSDLDNATRIACFIVRRAGMGPYACGAEERKKFAELGETLIAVTDSGMAMLNPFAQDFVEKTLADPSSHERVAVMLGQAFVDDYRLIRANVLKDYAFHSGVVSELLRLEELGGSKLEDIWSKLGDILVTWNNMSEEMVSWWPDRIVELENYFYNPYRKSESDEVLEGVSKV
ncbi:MAG: hypothetical protein A3B96_04290 [Candidatus Spechtbacteria bacterium RIFCSPHIGHO2_02_FULL_43_15b]|uniref:AAA+ ATPase domain-containing protein n=1 Tax=Candidatus Spechtbacteria bacterium RIFCSPHIGHO2_01_FULL_43_30 TaxID=1802158 RepID=A0A1G2H7I1_9BACT|nr:MAG: hypothetical protein A2827_01855 [Candidatus Spechtbacteria bacterium RIFCSPHIGHO2_01_FULL_43_30]OGZ58554.1 MAG: hypothetical protein A3B96_04290 [Candidatus Spechtbacteria bacterium RIFCSPHIGHO2_02_FULL_43_15b]